MNNRRFLNFGYFHETKKISLFPQLIMLLQETQWILNPKRKKEGVVETG